MKGLKLLDTLKFLSMLAGSYRPTVEQLSEAPLIDSWELVDMSTEVVAFVLRGVVTGHPTVRDGPAMTSAIAAMDVAEGWVRTATRHYRLCRMLRPPNVTDYEPLIDEIRTIVVSVGRQQNDKPLQTWASEADIIDTVIDGQVRFASTMRVSGRLPAPQATTGINTSTLDREVLLELVLRTASARARRWYTASQRLVAMPADWLDAIKVSSAAGRFDCPIQIQRSGGWVDLVLAVDEWCAEVGEPVVWGQIKQKTASLRMYANTRLNDEQADIVEHAESVLSEFVCEWCGSPGRRRHTENGWLYVSCREHVQS